MAGETTLRQAIEGLPNTTWVAPDGTLYKSDEALRELPARDLALPVSWSEDQNGWSVLREASAAGGGEGRILLTMQPGA
jgi:hypothetical protein